MPGGFQAQSNYEEGAAEKVFSFLDMSGRAGGLWSTVAWLLSLFLVILHLKTATLTLTPSKEGVQTWPHLRKLTVIESRPGEEKNGMA